MALHKMTFNRTSQTYLGGIVVYGIAIPEHETTEALVFGVVGLTGSTKHPTAYVLQANALLMSKHI